MTIQSPYCAPVRELDDPLREFRFLVFLYLIYKALMLMHIAGNRDPLVSLTSLDRLLVAVAGISFGVQVAAFVILPWRKTNALILRSFGTDAETNRMRQIVHHTLGWRFRLSGIRDPRKRASQTAKYFLTLVFLVRYSIPKYMNLEAGLDWKYRLVASFTKTKCVIVDLRKITPFVQDEIRLAVACLDWARVLFICHNSSAEDKCRQKLRRILGCSKIAVSKAQFAHWEDNVQGRQLFSTEVRAFRNGLPKEFPQFDIDAVQQEMIAQPDGVERTSTIEVVVLLTIVALTVVLAVAGYFEEFLNWLEQGIGVWFLLGMLEYVVECGSWVERCRIAIAVGIGFRFVYSMFYN